MDVVGVFREHVIVVDKLLRIGSGSGDADESEFADDLLDVLVFP